MLTQLSGTSGPGPQLLDWAIFPRCAPSRSHQYPLDLRRSLIMIRLPLWCSRQRISIWVGAKAHAYQAAFSCILSNYTGLRLGRSTEPGPRNKKAKSGN